jgi:hypothetical protein
MDHNLTGAQDHIRHCDELAEQMHVCTYDGLLYHRSEMVVDPMGEYIAIRNLDSYIEAQELPEYEQVNLYNQVKR